ncbi:MAG: hypothetical protein JXA68_05820 [Ignavibacteriales bacterium]|nr:hypothetical protein [Ignavibacteriales bacterium]
MITDICTAIKNKQLLKFYYEGGNRTVEPHCYGITTAGNEGLRGFQIDGYSSSGKMGWKMFDLSKANDMVILNESFNNPRMGYRKGDKGMSSIYCEI